MLFFQGTAVYAILTIDTVSAGLATHTVMTYHTIYQVLRVRASPAFPAILTIDTVSAGLTTPTIFYRLFQCVFFDIPPIAVII